MAEHLVIQLARFGDLLQTRRLLLSLAATPGDTVHLAVDPSLAPLARMAYPFAIIHEVLAHAAQTGAAEALTRNSKTFAALASISFATVYNLNFSGMALALAGLFDPDTVRGHIRRKGQETRSRWIRMGFRWMGERRAAPVNLVDFWAHLHPSPIAPDAVNPAARAKKNGKIAIVAAGRDARRSLPPHALAPLVSAVFAARGGPEITILGSRAERPFASRLVRLLPPAAQQRTRNTCGDTQLTDLPDILEECALVLSPDTGIMHLAAYLGVPVMAFFLSSAWCFETGPYGAGHTVFQATRSCAPCVESRPCPYSVACLAPFTHEAAIRAAQGKESSEWPENLLLLRSGLDAFGCDYVPVNGVMPNGKKRANMRALLAEYAGCSWAPNASAYPDAIFHETDWMLPPEAEGDMSWFVTGD